MNAVYGRDLDLNLLRVFIVVAETGSVTAAADRLYLTQPAISAACAGSMPRSPHPCSRARGAG
jgi:LysR family transcriptional activator of mexEF-oprN operon